MWTKVADSQGSALPGATKANATAVPTAPVVLDNKTAPGQTGPKGLAPRTTYSRVNTAPSPTPSLGEQAKSTPPRGMEFLPKLAHKENPMNTTFTKRPDIQDMVKSAMAATASRVNVSAEASRQQGLLYSEEEKTAGAQELPHVPTEVCEKYASALEWLASEGMKLAADPGSAETASPGVGPGVGAGALDVSESSRTEANIDAGQSGEAKAKIPTDPPMEKLPGQATTAANSMATDVDVTHPEQPEDPMGNAHASNAAQKTAAALMARNLGVLKKLAKSDYEKGRQSIKDVDSGKHKTVQGRIGGGLGAVAGGMYGGLAGHEFGGKKGALAGAALGGLAGGAGFRHLARKGADQTKGALDEIRGKEGEKEASALFANNLSLLQKLAEDAINPAQISAGAASSEGAEAPDGVSAAEEGPVPPMPAPANTQAGLIDSNEAAINYTKRDAKANMRTDMSHLLTEPMQGRSGDEVLGRTLEHTADAGAKIAAAQLSKTAAAKAVLLKLAKEQQVAAVAKAKKVKQSQAGGELSTPAGQSGFSAASSM